jgi:excisionase family DNA binding protein
VPKEILTWEELPDVLTTQQVAAFLQLSLSTVKRMCKNGELKAKKLGAGWRVNKADLQEYMQADNVSDSISAQATTDLITDLRTAGELIKTRIEGQDELVTHLLAHADRLTALNSESD